MSDPAFTPTRVDPGQEIEPSASTRHSWFRTREGRRYGTEIGLIIVVKLALLAALWVVLIHPWPRAVAPAAAVQQFYVPTPAARP